LYLNYYNIGVGCLITTNVSAMVSTGLKVINF
jgi:hypothetical protein